jgi:hypothetical protein
MRPSLALRAVAERTKFKGDAKLAELTTKAPAPNAYFHSGHGAEDLYEGNLFNEAVVPKGCAYVTSVECGRISFLDSARAIEFLRQWKETRDKGVRDMFAQARLRNAKGEEAREHIKGIFSAKSARNVIYKSNLAEFSLEGDSYINGMMMPVLCWHTEASASGAERYYAKPSGLQPQGVDFLTPIEIEDGVLTKDHIRAIYKDSLFPTAKELLADSVLDHVLGRKFMNDDTGDMEPNYSMVVDYINEEWACSSTSLLLAFPGIHYHLICRVPMHNSSHAMFRRAPKRKAKEVARSAIKANASKDHSLEKLSNSLIPKLLRGDEWKELEWRHFGNSNEKFAAKEEIPPIYPPNIGRTDGPMSWTDSQRHWALKELQIKHGAARGGKKATRRRRRR